MNKSIFRKVFIVSALLIACTLKMRSQIEVCVKQDTVCYTDEIKLTIINNDSIAYFCGIQLEKFDPDCGFRRYSENALCEPWEKGLIIGCPGREKTPISFKIKTPDWVIEKNGKYRDLTKAEILLAKQGLFRLKILPYKDLKVRNELITYSKPFIITKKSRKSIRKKSR